jgi:hypothetical protein
MEAWYQGRRKDEPQNPLPRMYLQYTLPATNNVVYYKEFIFAVS